MNQNIRLQKKNLLSAGLAIAIFSLALWILVLEAPTLSQGYLGAAVNQSLNTTVNITNAAPEVRSAVLDSSIFLEAYGEVAVNCTAVVFDWDNDTLTVNASLYLNGRAMPDGTLDNNTLYKNTSCTRMTEQDRTMNYTCAFPVQYYADNSTNWRCNVTAEDDERAYNSNISNAGNINALVAIYVPGVLNFGELAVNDISEDKLANITNAGNRNISIAAEGWGAVKGDGLAMNCSYGSIAVGYERYNLTTGRLWDTQMVQLTNQSLSINGLRVFHRFADTEIATSTNTTYWKLKIPALAGGICTGKILFTASDSGS
ncbi:MAG: hypothetical protein V1859_02015 [archaeon]